jgi:DNA-binding CsgD family transcriptional regulator
MNFAFALSQIPEAESGGITAGVLIPALRQMDAADSPEHLRDVLLETLRPFGFKGFTVAIDRRIKSLSVHAAVLATWPKGTNERYVSSMLFNRDPVMQRSHSSVEPFVWDMSIYDTGRADHRQLIELRRELGVDGGIVVPVMEAMGGRTVLFVSGVGFPSCKDTLLMLRVMLQHLAARLNQLRQDGLWNEPHTAFVQEAGLSARERQVLGWIALGKSSRDVSTIIGISEYTVNDHITSAMTKLSASNRTDAVIRALMLEDIALD